MVSAIDELINDVDSSICAVCFDVLEEALNNANPNSRDSLNKLISNDITCPLFVTWMTKSNDGLDEDLRGCIGTLEPVKIEHLRRYAYMSAFNDDRFAPISSHELESLICKVSILHSYEDCNGCEDWTIGTHGIIVNFVYNKKRYSATYLPEVALEHNMSKSTAINQLIRKSGYRFSITDDLLASLKVTRYQSKKIQMDYSEYKNLEN